MAGTRESYYYVRRGREDHIRYTPPLLTRYPLSEVYCNVITDRNRVYRTLVELELAVTNWLLELVSAKLSKVVWCGAMGGTGGGLKS